MRRLDYVPSWLDDAHTLLEKLNKCIAKIEKLDVDSTESINALKLLVTEVKATSENALKLPVSTPATEEVVTILPNGSQGSKPLSEIGGGSKLYKHDFMLKVTGTGALPNGENRVTMEKSLLSTISTPYTTLSQMLRDLTDMYFDDNGDMFIIVQPPSFDNPEETISRPPFRAYFGYQHELGTLQNPTFEFLSDTVTEL